ncbi:MAG: NAD(P)H:quinone oxidoreductase [Halanaerobiaceae bacterium]
MTNILIVYYSAYGHTLEMGRAVKEGSNELEATTVKMVKVPELEQARKNLSTQEAYRKAREAQKNIPDAELNDLEWADGIIWGIPTRFGNMPAQMKQFLDSAGGLWMDGSLEGKVTAIFTGTNTLHGGQESTVLSSLIPLLHFGMIFVGLPYGENPELMNNKFQGGSPYGASTVAGADGSRTPDENELKMASRLGKRVARVATALN